MTLCFVPHRTFWHRGTAVHIAFVAFRDVDGRASEKNGWAGSRMEKESHDLMFQSVLHSIRDTAFLIFYVAGRLHVGSASAGVALTAGSSAACGGSCRRIGATA